MKIEKFPLGILGANCYLLINEETKDTVVVDPGGHSKKFTAYIEEEKLNLVAILLTHGHFDHIMGIDSILENWNIPVYVEEEDLPIMTDPELNLSSSYTNGYSFDGAKPLKDGQKLELAGETIEVNITENLTYENLTDSEENLWSVLYLTGYLTKDIKNPVSGKMKAF